MKCIQCEHYDLQTKNCKLTPSEIDNTICLMRHITWVLTAMYVEEFLDLPDE